MSVFPMKILLATDGSEDAELALATAVNLAKSTDSELHVVTVAPGYPSYDVRIPEVAEELRRQAQDVLDDQVAKTEQAGGEVAQAHLRLAEHHPGFENHPSDDVVRVAEQIGAGLIVLGSRGLGGVKRALMGSVSDSVVRHAHCPVMVVRAEPVVFPTKILLATDGSDEAALAAQTAADLANKTDSELHIVHVRARITPHYPGYYIGPGVVEDAMQKEQKHLDREAQRLLDTQAEQVRVAGGSVAQLHLRKGRSDREIVELAEEIGAGLIVMGSRGLGRIRRRLLGSVSESVGRHAHCPVLVVRKEKQEEAGLAEVGLV